MVKRKHITLDKNILFQMFVEEFNKTTFTDTKDLTIKIPSVNIDKMTADIKDPVIYFLPEAYAKMRLLVNHCSEEIAWHGLVKRQDNIYIIYDVLVYPQNITSVTVESDDDGYPTWICQQEDEVINHMRMQGHSHVNMGVTPSGTDENFYHDLLKHVDDFYIIMIANKKGEVTLRLYDIPNNLLFYDLDFDFALNGQSGTAWYDEQFKQIKPKPAAVVNNYYNRQVNNYYDDEYQSRYGGYYLEAEEEDLWKDYNKKTNVTNVKQFKKTNELDMLTEFEKLEIDQEIYEADEFYYQAVTKGYYSLVELPQKKKGRKKNVKSK